MKLNATAKTVLREAGVSQTAWARANWFPGGRWSGDACGCPDDRCRGYHHARSEDCGCLRALLADYLRGDGLFAEFPRARS